MNRSPNRKGVSCRSARNPANLKDSSAKAIIVTAFEGSVHSAGAAADVDAALGRRNLATDAGGRCQGQEERGDARSTLSVACRRRGSSCWAREEGRVRRAGAAQRRGRRRALPATRRRGERRDERRASLGLGRTSARRQSSKGQCSASTGSLCTRKSRRTTARCARSSSSKADPSRSRAVRLGAERGRVGAEATNWARDLANEPANFMTPSSWRSARDRWRRSMGLEYRGPRAQGHGGDGHGRVPRRGAGEPAAAEAHRPSLRGRRAGREDARPRRQGHHLRYAAASPSSRRRGCRR